MEDVPMNDENAAPGLTTVSIEDFEKEHLKQIEARIQARRQAKESACGSEVQKSNVKSVAPSAAIPLDSPRQASQYMPEFTTLCQSKGISPVFDYYTPTGEFRALKGSAGGSPGFGARVTFAGREISLDGPYGSKKEARDRVAGKALEVLRDIVFAETAKEKADEQNWVGMLTEHAQALGVPYPDFQLFTVGVHFSCEVRLAEHPDEVLGSREATYPSKKLAKAAAAKSAVKWLQSNGHFEAEASRKKKKKTMVPVALVPIPIGSPSPAVSEAGLVQQITTLSNTLGLAQPLWDLKQNEQAPLFWDCSASFPNAPNMPDSVGAVRNIHGKKFAKEECARGVLDFLKEIEAERKERLAKLLGSAVAF